MLHKSYDTGKMIVNLMILHTLELCHFILTLNNFIRILNRKFSLCAYIAWENLKMQYLLYHHYLIFAEGFSESPPN